MRRRVLRRVGIGFLIGVFLGQITQMIISFAFGYGEYVPVVDEFRNLFNSELAAVITQFFLTGMIGVALSLGSFIFEIDHWGLLKQYLTHLFTTGAVWITVVLICWMPQNKIGLIILIANFVAAYGITYCIQLSTTKRDIEQIKAALQIGEKGGK